MWKYHTRKTMFCLCVDDFGVIYYSQDDIIHLQNILKPVYDIKTDWSGETFLDYALKWNYKKGYIDISMPEYIHHLLDRLQHKLQVSTIFFSRIC